MASDQKFAAADLAASIEAALAEVKRKPTEPVPRWHLAELLCFTGELERADKQLDTLLTLAPGQAISTSLFRNLVRGELSRREIAWEGRVPEFLTQPTPAVQSLLEARIALRAGDTAAAVQHAAAAEEQRPKRGGKIRGQFGEADFEDLRELDDLYGPVLEILSADGLCVWMPWEHLASIKFEAPTRPRDLIWRQASLMMTDGHRVNTYIPALYPGSYKETSNKLRAGELTEWREIADGLSQGVGQRMWYTGDDARSILDVTDVLFALR